MTSGIDREGVYSPHCIFNGKQGRYLFGDYSPFDENKNFINMLNDFVSVSSNIIHIHNNAAKLHLVFRNYELLQNEMLTNIEQFKTSTETLLDGFQKKYHEDIITTMFPTHADADPFFQSKNAIMCPLANTKSEFSGYYEKYRHYIQSKIIGSYKNAVILLRTWLSKDLDNLPYTLLSGSMNVLMISMDNEKENPYNTSHTTTLRVLSHGDTANSDAVHPSHVSYSFSIDCSSIEFWSHRRKVSDLGISNLLIPVGFKTPMSEKFKRSFRIVSGNSSGTKNADIGAHTEKEPEYISCDNYYLVQAKLENENALSITLAYDPTKLSNKVIRIDYGLSYFEYGHFVTNAEIYNKLISEGKLPTIMYVENEEICTLNLLQKEIQQITDISKILFLGKSLADKIRNLSKPKVATSELTAIRVDDRDAIAVSTNTASSSSSLSSSSPLLVYDEEIVIAFLQSLATGFAPLIIKLREKSPIKNELILRREMDNTLEEEYVIRPEELYVQLSATDEAKKVAAILGVSTDPS
ncbi:MAG TPA: hypothetical protein VFI73_02540 [Candidatus Nitrosopolaris sp.]|nr:hypothetical protein [Candidatus Nitrosopolaris sp.]